MNLNWKAMGVGFIVTLVLAIIGIYVPYLGLLAPIIGGLIAGYMVGGSYTDGIVNGGLSAAIAGFIYALVLVLLMGNIIASAVLAIIGAIEFLIIFFILGLIGGVIGVMIKGKPSEKPMAEPVPTARKSPIIVFNLGNIRKCICTTCPVQADSECAKEKTMKMQEVMESEEKMTLTHEDVPGMYCTTGKATCTDIDPSKECQCPNCPIWTENDLEHGQPMGVFCRDGKAM